MEPLEEPQLIQLASLGKNSKKCPEVRDNFAWHVSEEQVDEQQSKLSLFIHGGSTTLKSKKKKYFSDFFHLDVNSGIWRKFFLFDSAKARESHAMAKVDNLIYMCGGLGQNNTEFDDMWQFDLENVQWQEQK